MKYITLLLLISASAIAQKQFTVRDSITQKPLPYVSVNLGNGYAIYGTEDGEIMVQDADIKTVTLSCIGYSPATITMANSKDVVYLKPKPIQLDEVFVNLKKQKRIENVVKPKGHQDETQMTVSAIGSQYAFYISGSKNSYLSKIVMPIMKNDFVMSLDRKQSLFKKRDYKSLIKIEVLANADMLPGEKLNDYEQVVLIDNSKDIREFEVVLSEEIAIPENGLFVQLTILGNADEFGKLTTEMPYDIVAKTDGTQTKAIRQMQPHFPLYEAPKGLITYTNSAYSNRPWKKIEHTLVFNPNKTYRGFNIGFGYTTVVYQ